MQSKWRCNPWLKRIIVLGSCTAVGAFLYWRFYYDKTYPRPAFTLQTGAVGSLSAAAISPDGALLLTTRRFSRNDCILVWQTVTWEQIGTLNGPSERITCVKFSRKGDLLGCSSKDGTVRLWDARTWEEITTLHHDNPVLGIDFSPDGHTLAAAVAYDNDCQLKVPERVGVDLWDLNNNAKSIRLPLEVEPASGVVFSNDGEYVAIGCIDGTVVIWDVTKEKKRLTLKGHGSEVLSVAFSPDGKMLASASADHSARLWAVATGETQATLDGHQDRVFSVAFSPDGRLLATASDDETIRLWNSDTGNQIIKIRPHT